MSFHQKYAFLGLTILLTIIISVQSTTVSTISQAMQYLAQFGYMPSRNSTNGELISYDTLKTSIEDFQRFAGIKITGELDEETLKLMSTPRCGVSDKSDFGHQKRSKRYSLQGSRWEKKHLTYKIMSYPDRLIKSDVDNEISRAFAEWEKYVDLNFKKSSSNKADILVKFEADEHGDGDAFDNMGGTLAHAYFPIYGGDLHFDKDEWWTINTTFGTNLFQVAVHEIGHSLGLQHSDVKSAIMAPFYRGFVRNFKMDDDDIEGIQELYGIRSSERDFNSRYFPRPTNRPAFSPPIIPGNHLVCKDPKIDAIFYSGDRQLYAFKNDKCYKLISQSASVAAGYPKLISDEWPGLPANIDAAFTLRNRKTYFFAGTQYWRYNEYRQKDKGYPQEIRYGFPRIPNNLDAATVCGGIDEKICFFKKNKFWIYDASRGPPKVSIQKISKRAGLHKLDAALTLSNGETIIFKDKTFYRVAFNLKPIDFAQSYFQYPLKRLFGCKEIPSTPGALATVKYEYESNTNDGDK